MMMFFKKPDNIPKKHWYSGIFLIFLSVVLFWISWSVAKDRHAINKKSLVATGVVVQQTHGKQHVVIEFSTEKGDIVKYDQNGGSYEIGDIVKVFYLPENPKLRTTTSAFWPMWGISTKIALAGTFTLFFGILSMSKPQYVRFTGDK